jgi:hypothetical protein
MLNYTVVEDPPTLFCAVLTLLGKRNSGRTVALAVAVYSKAGALVP